LKENKPARNAKESKTERMRAFLNDETLFSDYSVGEYETKRSRVLNSLSEIYPNDLYVKTCDMDSGANYERPASEGENVYNSLHYVIRGKGVFECNGVKYNIEKDTLFIVPADVESKYFSDSANPWTYIYIDIGGVLQQSIIRQLGFDSKRRIARFKPDNEVGKKFMEVYESVMDTDPWSLKTTAALYGLLYEIKRLRLKKIPYDSKNRYIRQAMGVIRNNISYVTVAGIAKACSVSPEYLTRICKNRFGISMKDLITLTRLQTACNYLKYTRKSVKSISEDVGFIRPKYFTKVFKSVVGMPPAEYRKKYQLT